MEEHPSRTLIHTHHLTRECSHITIECYAASAFKLEHNYGYSADSNSTIFTDGYLCAAEFLKKGNDLHSTGLKHPHISHDLQFPRSQIRSRRRKNKLYSSQSIHSLHPQQPGSESNLLRRAVRKQQKATHWDTRTCVQEEFLHGLVVLALLKCLVLTE